MLPFALPMVLAPRVTNRLAARHSGRVLLSAGLALAALGDTAFWIVAGSHLPYGVFVIAMLIAGCGAGLLNGQTVKVLQSAVPEDRAGMASGLASTTRFIGILVSVAGLGAVLSGVSRGQIMMAASKMGLTVEAAKELAWRASSGDLPAILAAAQPSLREALRTAALSAYGAGFASAALAAAGVAIAACLLAFNLISEDETAASPVRAPTKMPCKVVDCRDPL
jgi:hypothetical protein